MDHSDHTNLLRAGIRGAGLSWGDLGAGSGAFTLALADLLGAAGEIHAVDRDASALRKNATAMSGAFPNIRVTYQVADFTLPLELPVLDGIVMANSLHFQNDQEACISRIRGHLSPGGRMLIVEYNLDAGNFAVPYPLPYRRWQLLSQGAGFEHTQLLARRPGRSLGEIYSAVSW